MKKFIICLAALLIIVNSVNVTAQNAGSDQVICGATAVLAASPFAGASWSLVSGDAGIIISDPASPSSTVSNLGFGISIFRWTLPSTAFDDVMITNNEIPSNASVDQQLCNIFNTTLDGNPPAPGSGIWTIVNSPGVFSDPSIPNTTVTGMTMGENAFQWNISHLGCNTSDIVLVHVYEDVVATVSTDDAVCDLNSYGITAATPTVGLGIWTRILGTATIDNPTLNSATVTGLAPGINAFQWTVTNGACIDSDVLEVDVYISTTPNAGPDEIVCEAISYQLNADASAVTGNGVWSVISGSGIFSNSVLESSTVTGLSNGVNVYRWTYSNGPCGTSFDDVEITNNFYPIVNAGPDESLCDVTTYNLSGNEVVDASSQWSVISSGATLADEFNRNTIATNLSEGDNIFRWTILNNGCEAYDEVNIHRDVTIAANAGLDDSSCSSDYQLSANDPSPGIGSWSSSISGLGFSDPSSPSSQVLNLPIGSNSIIWNITNGACSSADEVIITRITPPNIPDITGNDSVCGGQNGVVYSTVYNSGHSYSWTVFGGSIVSGQLTNEIVVDWWNSTEDGSIGLVETDLQNCDANNSLPINIDVGSEPRVIVKGEKLLICLDSGMTDYQWFANGTAIPNANDQFYYAENQDGDYFVQILSQNNCSRRSIILQIVSNNALNLFPNPADFNLTISLKNEEVGELKIQLKDIRGVIVKTELLKKEQLIFRESITVGGIKQGVYLLEVYLNNKLYQSKRVMVN